MATIENRVENLEGRFMTLEQQVSTVATKLDMFIAESREARKRQDDDMREFRDYCFKRELLPSIDRLRKRVNTLTIINLLGYVVIIIAVYLK